MKKTMYLLALVAFAAIWTGCKKEDDKEKTIEGRAVKADIMAITSTFTELFPTGNSGTFIGKNGTETTEDGKKVYIERFIIEEDFYNNSKTGYYIDYKRIYDEPSAGDIKHEFTFMPGNKIGEFKNAVSQENKERPLTITFKINDKDVFIGMAWDRDYFMKPQLSE